MVLLASPPPIISHLLRFLQADNSRVCVVCSNWKKANLFQPNLTDLGPQRARARSLSQLLPLLGNCFPPERVFFLPLSLLAGEMLPPGVPKNTPKHTSPARKVCRSQTETTVFARFSAEHRGTEGRTPGGENVVRITKKNPSLTGGSAPVGMHPNVKLQPTANKHVTTVTAQRCQNHPKKVQASRGVLPP